MGPWIVQAAVREKVVRHSGRPMAAQVGRWPDLQSFQQRVLYGEEAAAPAQRLRLALEATSRYPPPPVAPLDIDVYSFILTILRI